MSIFFSKKNINEMSRTETNKSKLNQLTFDWPEKIWDLSFSEKIAS